MAGTTLPYTYVDVRGVVSLPDRTLMVGGYGNAPNQYGDPLGFIAV